MRLVSRIRDLLTTIGDPSLRKSVLAARSAGLVTLLDYQRLALITGAVRHTLPLRGDLIECGVYRGGSAALIARCLVGSGKTLHACDSFRGLPTPGALDNFHVEGDFSDASAAAVRAGLTALALPVVVHEGLFSDSLPALSDCQFVFAHIDVDLYESVMFCLDFLYERMHPGAVMIFDDYGAPTCRGAKAAVDEFFDSKQEKPAHLTGSAHGVLVGARADNLLTLLRRNAGWTLATPGLGRLLLR